MCEHGVESRVGLGVSEGFLVVAQIANITKPSTLRPCNLRN